MDTDSRKILCWTLFLILLTGCTSDGDITPVPTVNPDQLILFHNGVVLTMNPEKPQAVALAIKGEKIIGVGSNKEILILQEPDATVIDLQGATIMPGFVESHSHLFNDAKRYLDMSLPEVQQLALENGITTLGNLYTDESFLKQMQEFNEEGQLQIRTSLYLVATDNCGRLKKDWWRDYPQTDEPGEMLRFGGVKIFTDGGTCERPALSYELREGEGLGDLFLSQKELDDLVGRVHAAGRQVAIHAIGDRAVEQAQNAIADALLGQPNDQRHRIEHNSVIRPELLSRYGEIGIVPIIYAMYATCEPFGPPPPQAYQGWEWPWQALVDANPGLQIAWHGDDPFFGRVRPLDDLYGFVTRNDIATDGTVCPGYDWLKQNSLTVDEALPMMTINAAYTLFRDDEVGSLKPGKYADIIVLSGNPLAIAAEQIPDLDVWMTMVGGRVAHCASEHQAICP